LSVTIREIAEHTGLSIPTVGNVLGRAANRYSAQTRELVKEACRELGYRPNSSARAMRNGKIGCAALVLSRSHSQILSHVPVGLLDGLDDELALHNMHLTVSRLTDEQLSSDEMLPKVIREYMADGMIVNYTHEIPPRMLELIHAHHAPAVWLNAKLREDCVHPDDVGAAEAATKQLIALGHRRIAMVHLISSIVFGSGSFEQARARFHYSVADRAAGYFNAMRDAGLKSRITFHDRFVEGIEQIEACRALLAAPDRPTAVLLYSELDLSALLCAASSLRLSIPKDLSVATFYPTGLGAAGLSVTPVAIPTHEIGRRAVRMLLKKIASPDDSFPADAVLYSMSTGQTVAPPA